MNEDTILINNRIEEDKNENRTDVVTEIYLNGIFVDHYTSLSNFILFSKDNRMYHTRKYEPELKQLEYSYFYPFTCSCGEAGCAGIWDGIYSKYRKYSVEWRIPKDSGYKFLDKTFYSFNRRQYEEQIQKCIDFLNENKDTLVSHDYYDDKLVPLRECYSEEVFTGKI